MLPQNGSSFRPLFKDTKLAWVGVTKNPLRVPKGQKVKNAKKFQNVKITTKIAFFGTVFAV